ncbi:hypothetical protein ZIOFF_005004 [Zingiber officinale]|uniref:Uncharacterized protein n=1 Tax=Zingiber officinale TaxID=94328 RepID=A0A8J5IBQ8_ZINOF|nr:hypothetical protein ZIOFF_005004 [Zingiber officinale]
MLARGRAHALERRASGCAQTHERQANGCALTCDEHVLTLAIGPSSVFVLDKVANLLDLRLKFKIRRIELLRPHSGLPIDLVGTAPLLSTSSPNSETAARGDGSWQYTECPTYSLMPIQGPSPPLIQLCRIPYCNMDLSSHAWHMKMNELELYLKLATDPFITLK